MIKACILGCSTTQLTPQERDFFAENQPWGFILFKRNIQSPDQLRKLIVDLRQTVGQNRGLDQDQVPILIDQEGGRVQRLGPPHWPAYPTARQLAKGFQKNPSMTRTLVRLHHRLIAHDLKTLGINMDAAPVLDIPTPEAHDVIGDRAYGEDVETVLGLARSAAEGLLAGGVLPVIKHIPGHGRALVDSHIGLPQVVADAGTLEASDFRPFRLLSDMPVAMTAHIVYEAFDTLKPATLSSRIIKDVIRDHIGFQGLLMSDDVSMGALGGALREASGDATPATQQASHQNLASLAKSALEAGCDLVLHCNGRIEEMQALIEGVKPLDGLAKSRAAQALARLPQEIEPLDVVKSRRDFEKLLIKLDG